MRNHASPNRPRLSRMEVNGTRALRVYSPQIVRYAKAGYAGDIPHHCALNAFVME